MPALSKYTYFQLCFIKECYKYFRVPELTREFNKHFNLEVTETAIKSCITNHGFKSGRAGNVSQMELMQSGKSKFSLEQHYFIEELHKHHTPQEIAELFEIHYGQKHNWVEFRHYCHNNHFKADPARQKFSMGHQSWNRGSKGLVKPNSGNFKKGSVPANLKPMFHERTVKGEIYIKVPRKNPYTGAPTRYIQKAHWEWEQANGQTVPKGMVVRFKDTNNRNFSYDNLICITKRMNLMLNRIDYKSVPEELREVAFTTVEIEVAIFERLEKLTSEKYSN